MRHPGAVMAVAGLALLVGMDAAHRLVVGLRIVLDRNLRRHAAHRMHFAAMAGLDHELAVGAQEVRGHADLAAIRQHRPLLLAELLDEAEDVVPAAAVEAGRMVLQLPQDLVHLEGGEDGLDQHGGLDRLLRHAERVLGGHEHVVPQPRLEMALELGQVEVGAGAARQRFLGVVEEVEAEIEQRPRHRLAVDRHVPLEQMPAARAHEQHRRLVVQLVGLAAIGIDIVDLAADRVGQIVLALDHVGPGRRRGVLEVGHEDVGAAVERVDDHLAVDRPGDLDATVEDVLGQRRHGPVALADLGGLRQEVRLLAGIEALLALDAGGQKLLAAGVELALQVGDERDCLFGKHLFEAGLDHAVDRHARRKVQSRHVVSP